MPPAKKPATRRSARATSASTPTGPITRREVEQATARFEKALDEATKALSAMRQDLGAGARTAYKDIAAGLKTIQRDAVKTNKALIKDLDKLRASVTPAKRPARTASRSTAAGARDQRAHAHRRRRRREYRQQAGDARGTQAGSARDHHAQHSLSTLTDEVGR